MAEPIHNPRAFPSAAVDDRFGGMTLRDWMAGQALAGDLGSQGEVTGEWPNHADDSHLLARAAFYYRFADAMLAQRKIGEGAE